jgi:hypothetical protein
MARSGDIRPAITIARPPTERLAGPAQAEIVRTGDVAAAFASAARVVEGRYSYPFLAHGPLEPQNCTALFRDGGIEIWAPTQNPESGRALVAKALGLAPGQIRINLARIGGGFGRRLMNDYMVQAAALARQVPGTPVKLIYSRQDELRRDFFRPAGWHGFRVALDQAGKLVGFHDHFISFGIDGRPNRAAELPGSTLPAGLVANLLFEQSLLATNLPSGWLRAPGSNGLGFAFQGFLDEVAEAAGKDLPQLMLELLGEAEEVAGGRGAPFLTSRAKAVIRKVLAMSRWEERGTLPGGHGLGLAFFFSQAGYFAEVLEVAVNRDTPKVLSVWVAGDVGSQIVNPLNALQQVHGSVIEGLGQALAGQKITQVDGAVEQGNFDGHPFQRIAATPRIQVEFVLSDGGCARCLWIYRLRPRAPDAPGWEFHASFDVSWRLPPTGIAASGPPATPGGGYRKGFGANAATDRKAPRWCEARSLHRVHRGLGGDLPALLGARRPQGDHRSPCRDPGKPPGRLRADDRPGTRPAGREEAHRRLCRQRAAVPRGGGARHAHDRPDHQAAPDRPGAVHDLRRAGRTD